MPELHSLTATVQAPLRLLAVLLAQALRAYGDDVTVVHLGASGKRWPTRAKKPTDGVVELPTLDRPDRAEQLLRWYPGGVLAVGAAIGEVHRFLGDETTGAGPTDAVLLRRSRWAHAAAPACRLKIDLRLLEQRARTGESGLHDLPEQQLWSLERWARALSRRRVAARLAASDAQGVLNLTAWMLALHDAGVPVDLTAGGGLGGLVGAFWGVDRDEGLMRLADLGRPLRRVERLVGFTRAPVQWFARQHIGYIVLPEVLRPVYVQASGQVIETGGLARALREADREPPSVDQLRARGADLVLEGDPSAAPGTAAFDEKVRRDALMWEGLARG